MERDDDSFEFRDPFKSYPLKLRVVPISEMEVVKHQRKPSEYHVKHLISSIQRIGFLIPIIVVEDRSNKGRYIIIDGQHRFLAAKKLGIDRLPVIVVPYELAGRMMNFNIEKELNIREKSYVALAVYKEYLGTSPEVEESDPRILDSIEQAYYITLGIAYERTDRLAGSAFEPILRKCDGFLPNKLIEAYKERQSRAETIMQANSYVRAIAEKIKEIGKWHPFVYQQIISAANPYKRKRKVEEDFNSIMAKMIERLKDIEHNPEQILRETVELQ